MRAKPGTACGTRVIIVSMLICIPAAIFGASVDKPCTLRYGSIHNMRIDLPDSHDLNLPFMKNIGEYETVVPSGRQVRLTCTEDDNVFRNLEVSEVELVCNGGVFHYKENPTKFSGELIQCLGSRNVKRLNGELRRNGTCENNATNIDVYVKSSTSGKPSILYSICFEETTSTTLYSKSYIDGEALATGGEDPGKPRPKFQDQGFFPFNVDLAYTRKQEKEILSELLGPEMVEEYIPTEQYFLSRGHLFPNGDPFFKYQKDATFFFVNVVPQWQILNNGNWKSIEDSFRNVAKELKSKIRVWTGTHGVVQLKDVHDKDVELWMGLPLERDLKDITVSEGRVGVQITEQRGLSKKRLPVPKFLWKVAYDENESSAIAVVQINNPWVEKNQTEFLCKDICDQVNWLQLTKSQRSNAKKGFTYCCDVNDLRKTVSTVPKLKYSKILNIVHSSEEDSEEEYSDSDADYDIHGRD